MPPYRLFILNMETLICHWPPTHNETKFSIFALILCTDLDVLSEAPKCHIFFFKIKKKEYVVL